MQDGGGGRLGRGDAGGCRRWSSETHSFTRVHWLPRPRHCTELARGDVSATDVCDGIVRTRVRRERESGALCRKRAEGEPETVTGQPSLASDAVIRSHVFAGQGCQRVRNRPVSFVDTRGRYRSVPQEETNIR